jgi:Fe-S cluster biogenesis protein NfuA
MSLIEGAGIDNIEIQVEIGIGIERSAESLEVNPHHGTSRRSCFGALLLLTGDFLSGTLTFVEEQKEKAVDKEIAIVGEPTINPATCKFTVDRSVYPGGSAYFGNREAARYSPLAQKVFELPEVENILIAENQLTVTKSGFEAWPVVGKRVGGKIREHIQSGEPAVKEEFDSTMPTESEIREKVQGLLEREINPALGMHGGWVELIDVKKNAVFLRLGGGCQGCASANMTLKMGIEKAIREQIPEVGEILDTTDHASGRNPYYQP